MQTIPSMSQQVVLLMGFCMKLFGKNTDHFYAPVAGKTVPINDVPDPTFNTFVGKSVTNEDVVIELVK